MFDKILTAVLYLGGALMLTGVAGGAANLLSDPWPLALAAIGTGLMFLVLITFSAINLWYMDEDR